MSEKYRGFDIDIQQDENPDDPRNWDNLGKMVCFHGDYELGDKHDYKTEGYDSWDELKRAIIENEKAVAIYPLFLYDHSGLRIKIGSFRGLLPEGHAEFDTMPVGFIYATPEAIKETYGVKRITKKTIEKVKGVLVAEVETYDKFLSGSFCGYIVTDEKGKDVNSCWGYEDYETALAEAKEVVDCEILDREKEKEKRLKGYIKNRVPLVYRQT